MLCIGARVIVTPNEDMNAEPWRGVVVGYAFIADSLSVLPAPVSQRYVIRSWLASKDRGCVVVHPDFVAEA